MSLRAERQQVEVVPCHRVIKSRAEEFVETIIHEEWPSCTARESQLVDVTVGVCAVRERP